MILKTYARIVTGDMEATLTSLRRLTAKDVDLRFTAGDMESRPSATSAYIAAPPEKQGALREVVGPVIVDDLLQTRTDLLRHGALIVQDCSYAPTGTLFYSRDNDGVIVEWLQFSPCRRPLSEPEDQMSDHLGLVRLPLGTGGSRSVKGDTRVRYFAPPAINLSIDVAGDHGSANSD